MKKATAIILIILMLILSACAGGTMPTVSFSAPAAENSPAAFTASSRRSSVERLRLRVEDYLCDMSDGEISVFVWDLGTDNYFAASNGDDVRQSRFSASLIKLYIMLAAYQSEALGLFNTGDYTNALTQMIAFSDNDEANFLIDELGGIERVNMLIEPFGFSDTRLNKYIGLNLPGPENVTSVSDCARLLHGIYTGTLISPDASRAMLNLLLQQDINTKMPVPLPVWATVAHKTGEYFNEANHDVGIVFSGDSDKADYILCVMVNDVVESEAVAVNIALSRLVWNYFSNYENYVSIGFKEQPENVVSHEVTVRIQDGSETYRQNDGNYGTVTWLSSGTDYTFTSHEPFSYLYLIWDSAPGVYELKNGEQTLAGGENAYLHELIKLDAQTNEVSLRLQNESVALCDVYAYSQGILPDFVQDWQSITDNADILVFPTHADDEMLFFGGIIPTFAGELGQKVQVIFLTNHKIREPVRNHELLNALWHAGDPYYPVVSEFPDRFTMSLEEALELYDNDEVVAFQVEMIRRFKPHAIYGHDEAGEYGHGVHQLNTYCLEQAVVNAADSSMNPDSYARYGTWDTPELWIHMYPYNQVVMDWHVPLSHFGGKTALEVAREAYRFHESQLIYDFEVLEYGEGDCRLFGLWREAD